MLRTNLDHLETEDAMNEALQANENVMIFCGRMGPMCLPVYAIMDELKTVYPHVKFFDQDFDGPASSLISNLPECADFMSLPLTFYFKQGKPVKATGGIQNRDPIMEILDGEFGEPA